MQEKIRHIAKKVLTRVLNLAKYINLYAIRQRGL